MFQRKEVIIVRNKCLHCEYHDTITFVGDCEEVCMLKRKVSEPCYLIKPIKWCYFHLVLPYQDWVVEHLIKRDENKRLKAGLSEEDWTLLKSVLKCSNPDEKQTEQLINFAMLFRFVICQNGNPVVFITEENDFCEVPMEHAVQGLMGNKKGLRAVKKRFRSIV